MDNTRWLDDQEANLWRAWIRVASHLQRVISADLRGSSLNDSEFAVLATLTDVTEGVMPLGELGRRLDWETSRLSHQVSRMAKRGMVVKRTSHADRRSAIVSITDAGRDAIEQAAPSHVDTVRRELLDRLSASDREVLADVLGRLAADLDAEARTAP